jgi:predicted nucleic acid-binding protein
MTTVFADATFYIAAASPRDQNHLAARRFAESFSGRVVTTEYVLTEVANFLSGSARRAKFLESLRAIQKDRNTEIVPSTHDLWLRGLEFYARRTDKDWSLTDCISFVVMTDRGLKDALTADHDFEQGGFNVLLK